MTDYHVYNQARQDLMAADQLLQWAAHHHGRGNPDAARNRLERALKRIEAAHAILQAAVQGPPPPPAGAEEALPA